MLSNFFTFHDFKFQMNLQNVCIKILPKYCQRIDDNAHDQHTSILQLFEDYNSHFVHLRILKIARCRRYLTRIIVSYCILLSLSFLLSLFYSILFYLILHYLILPYFILPYSTLSYTILFYLILFYLLFYSILFYSTSLNTIRYVKLRFS